LLRDEVKNGTEIGRECEQLMKDGKLVPVEVTLKLIKKAMKESKDGATGFLIDGFPRAVDQAEVFEKKVT
jgi:adenylate kinase